MVKTIGNPLSFTARALGAAAQHVGASVDQIGQHNATEVEIRHLTLGDLRDALRLGAKDFAAARADVFFLVVLYPVIGLILVGFAFNLNLLPLLFPLAAGFALLGPLAAVGLYEISRRREKGEPASWGAALGVIASPAFGSIVVLGLYLLAIFTAWMIVANWIFALTLGPEPPVSAGAFLSDVLHTSAGRAMIVIGMVVGFGFAVVVLATSVVSFPLLLDRRVGVPAAIVTSIQVAKRNPRVIAIWGLVVAIGLLIGSIPLFIGLMVTMPILGHATWHLYRRAIG
ncbi:MAG: DUF2189 domain-containing protein [Rhodobacter sp.]|nr:DUF2189 domain-containing protein [Rhodobacter sp.]